MIRIETTNTWVLLAITAVLHASFCALAIALVFQSVKVNDPAFSWSGTIVRTIPNPVVLYMMGGWLGIGVAAVAEVARAVMRRPG